MKIIECVPNFSEGCNKDIIDAIAATTLNGAAAIEADKYLGSIEKGKFASFFITEQLPSMAFLLYAYSTPLIKRVVLKGNDSQTYTP